MNNGHPSEMELQQYALEPSGCNPETLEHMEACPRCRAEAAAYRLLFTGISEQPEANFDFDLSAAVLSRLPIGTGKFTYEPPAELSLETPGSVGEVGRIGAGENTPRFGPGAWAMGFLCCCTVVIPLYLFRKNIGSMFDGMSLFFMYSAAAAAGIIVLSRLIGMYKKYLRQMEALNF